MAYLLAVVVGLGAQGEVEAVDVVAVIGVTGSGGLVIAEEEDLALRQAADDQALPDDAAASLVPLEEVVGQHSGVSIGQIVGPTPESRTLPVGIQPV